MELWQVFKSAGKHGSIVLVLNQNLYGKAALKLKKEAQVAASEIEEKLRKSMSPRVTKVLFDEYFKSWVDVYRDDIGDITRSGYYITLGEISESFAGRYINDITKREYQEFLNDFGAVHAKETVRKLNTHIRACVQEAIEEGIIQFDFTRKAKLTGSVESKRPEEKHLNYVESQKLLNELYERKDKSIGYYLLILALTSGMRFAEIVGLTTDDFNFDLNEITINKTWDYKKEKVLLKPKMLHQIGPLKWTPIQ